MHNCVWCGLCELVGNSVWCFYFSRLLIIGSNACKIVSLPSGHISNNSCNIFLSLTRKLPTRSDPVIFVLIESGSLCDLYSVYSVMQKSLGTQCLTCCLQDFRSTLCMCIYVCWGRGGYFFCLGRKSTVQCE